MARTLKDRVTVGFVNYNNLEMVEECIGSVLSQDCGPYRMIFVDNGSTDGSREIVQKKYSKKLNFITLDKNLGPNPARNLILKESHSELVLFLDADVVLEKDVIKKLVNIIDASQITAIVAPKIMDYDDRTKVQFNGTLIHYIGAAIHPENKEDLKSVTSLGGACLLVRKEIAEKINGWDEDFYFGWTDGDFVYRAVLAGYEAKSIASAKLYHPYRRRGFSKAYYQVLNRWHFMLKTYAWRTLILIFPVICLYELFLLGFLLVKKQGGTYFKANFALLRMLPAILQKRDYVQRLRKANDKEMLTVGNFTIRDEVTRNKWLFGVIRTFNRTMDLYWLLVRRFC